MELFYFAYMLKQIPNVLTITRLLLVAPFLVCLRHHEFVHAFYIFIIAGCTDGLDGRLARSFAWQSHLGAIMDPLADKILITVSFIGLAWLHILPWWVVLLVLFRDVTISLGVIAWYIWISKSPKLKPTYISKINTGLQLSLVLICLFEKAFFMVIPMLKPLCMSLMVFTTSVSLIDYVWTWGKEAWRRRK